MLILLLTYNIGVNALEDKEEKKLIKDTGEYFGNNYIKLDGTGNTITDIVDSYIKYINEGYNLTVEEICNYLQCSSTYFLNNYRDSIKHIRITVMVRDAFFQLLRAEMISLTEDAERLISMFLKRILYNREDFNRFIKENCLVEHKYKRFSLDDLELYPKNYEDKRRIIELLNFISYDLYLDCKEPITKPLDYIPYELHSLKNLKEYLDVKYDVEFYRLIQQQGINKIKLGNLVRYDIAHFDSENEISVNYKAWKRLGNEKIIAEILKCYEGFIRNQKNNKYE
jgi:hypothetical protein